jgi:type I restriction enzyme M protein
MLIKGQDIANIIFGNTLSDDGLPGQASTTCSPTRPSAWSGRRSRRSPQGARAAGLQRPLRPRPAARERRLAAVPAAPGQQDAPGQETAAAASASCSTARRCSPAAPARARARSAATCWRTTWSRPSSACPPTCSTTPASAPTSGSSATASRARKGKVQLIDASGFWQKMRKSLGSKRKELSPEHIDDITRLFGDFEEASRDGVPISRIFKNEDFGYRTITVERPSATRRARSCWAEGQARASRCPTPPCATPRTCR